MKKKKCKQGIEIIDLSDILGTLCDNVSEDAKTFEDVLNLDNSLNRHIYLEDIESGIGATVASMITFWNRYDDNNNIDVEDRQPIKIYIDSYGGSLTDAFTIIDAIKMSKTPVWTITTGCGYSAGFFIGLVGHRRIGYPHSSYLYHEGSTANSGTAGQFRNFADFYDRQLEQLKELVLMNTNIDENKYKEIKKDDVWLTAEDALEWGALDEITSEVI